MLIELNYLEYFHNNPTMETEKQINHFLNYCESHPDYMTEYKRSDMILHLYSDASYLSEPEAHSRSGGYFS